MVLWEVSPQEAIATDSRLAGQRAGSIISIVCSAGVAFFVWVRCAITAEPVDLARPIVINRDAATINAGPITGDPAGRMIIVLTTFDLVVGAVDGFGLVAASEQDHGSEGSHGAAIQSRVPVTMEPNPALSHWFATAV